MKRIAALVLVLCMLSACTTQTEYGKCIGVTDKGKPGLVYKASAWNIFLGIIFIETIIVPIIVLLDEFQCPVEKQ
jgi:hypothetical protein